jgi:4,5-dihydroxyphthalate decarboxylase
MVEACRCASRAEIRASVDRCLTVPAIPLTLACWDYDRTRALMDGRVKVEGVDLTYLPIGMPESFFRMLRHREFGASEMSLSWYTRTRFSEQPPFIAIPVFPSRMFRHSSIYVHADAGIIEPVDLVGRVIGCPEYQMTAAVWIKGMLSDHYGVPVDSVTYRTGGLKQPGRRETPMDLPDRIRVEPIGDDQTLSELLERGEVDALYTAEAPSTFEDGSPNVRRLFTDHAEVERDFFQATGVFPIMHTVVVRQDVYAAQPWIAQSLTKAFEAAKDAAVIELEETVALKTMLPWLWTHLEETRAILGQDYWPYGLDANRTTLETFLRYSYEQGLSPRLLQPEQLFAPETLATARI